MAEAGSVGTGGGFGRGKSWFFRMGKSLLQAGILFGLRITGYGWLDVDALL